MKTKKYQIRFLSFYELEAELCIISLTMVALGRKLNDMVLILTA